MTKTKGRLVAAAAATLLAISMLSGCTTLGDTGPAICHADDGTMVPVRDSKCPEAVRRTLQPDTGAPVGVDQSINNDLYNAQNGLSAGDTGAR
ncbi:MAG: hypothetical protein ABI377_02580 [Devosia sp.]